MMEESAEREAQEQNQRALEEFAVRTSTLARQSLLDRAAATATRALEADGIEAILLKGIALSRVLYHVDEPRGYFDVDMLVGPKDLAPAGRVLEALGYQNMSKLHGIVDVAGIQHAEMWAKSDPAEGNVTIDLHWRLAGCEAPSERVWEALRPHRWYIDVGGARLATLDRSGLGLHLALHAAQHGADDVKARGDLMRGLSRWDLGVWRGAARLAGELQAVESFAAGLRLVPDGARLADDELELPSAEALLWEIANRDVRPRGTYHLRALSEAANTDERLRVLRHALLPSRTWIIRHHRWADRGGLRLVAAYAVHILRSPAWGLRAWRYRRRLRRQG
jgi:hypothetical protein